MKSFKNERLFYKVPLNICLTLCIICKRNSFKKEKKSLKVLINFPIVQPCGIVCNLFSSTVIKGTIITGAHTHAHAHIQCSGKAAANGHRPWHRQLLNEETEEAGLKLKVEN